MTAPLVAGAPAMAIWRRRYPDRVSHYNSEQF